MSVASAQPKYSFGLKGDVARNIWYLDEQNILYPSGANLIIFNIDQKTQRFIPCSLGSEGMTSLAVSPNKRYAAVAEKRTEKSAIVIIDLTTLKKKKTLVLSESSSSADVISMCFSPDSKYLISQLSRPDWTLAYWHWEKSKCMASIKSNGVTNYAINQVSFNLQDNTQICVVGEKTFKLFRYSEGHLKQFAFMKAEPSNYHCLSWISEDRLVVGTDSGTVQLFEVGELKNEFSISQVGGTTPDPISSRKSIMTSRSSGRDQEPGEVVGAIVTFSKGFICSGGSGILHIFEKTTDKYLYKKSRSVSVWVDPNSSLVTHPGTGTDVPVESNDITNIAMSPSEENIICTTRTKQIYNLMLSAVDLQGKDVSNAAFDYLSYSFHQGAITGMDLCLRKPIIATCSLDKSVRIWNYENNSLDIYKEFQEEAYSVALHPSGLFILVGFSEKLRLMNLLIDDIRPFKEFLIRGCKECAFANGGHMFAAANTNLIQLFFTYTFENFCNLKGHNGKVRCIKWSTDDSHLLSCSMDGAVYDWSVQACKREREYILKSCSYTSLAFTSDLKTTFAVGSDRTLNQINLQDSSCLRQLNFDNAVLTQVVMSHSGRMVFTGTATGAIRAVKYPLTEAGEWQDYQAHSASISKMSMSYDDQFLFSVGMDGSLFAFRVVDKEGRGLKREKDITFSEEVLVTKSDLEEKNTLMSELKTRVEELRMENEYQLRLKDMNYNEKTKELTDKFLHEIEMLKARNEKLITEKETDTAKHQEKILEMHEKHATELQDIDTVNSNKLMAEYEKYQELQARSQKLQEEYEQRIAKNETEKDQALQQLTSFYEGKLQEKDMQLQQAAHDQQQQLREAEELQRQTEEDVDREILDLKNRYERQLRQRWEENTKLRGEVGILTKKVGSLQDDIKGLKDEIHKLKQETRKRDGIIASLKTDIEGLKKEIQERDETIQEKEKHIFSLKKKNQELEKFKFVLDYKIKELRRQMEPRENEIKRMKEQIRKMEGELSELSRDKKKLELAMTENKHRLSATTKEMMNEREQCQNLKVELRNVKAGLHNTSRFIQEPKELKEAVKALYKQHLHDFDKTARAEQKAESDMQSEYARQREHLEKSVSSLRRKLTKDSEIHRADTVRVMQENVILLKEINDLRTELKRTRTQSHDLEATLKIARKQGFGDHTSGTTSTSTSFYNKSHTSATSQLMKVEPQDEARIIEMQKIEIGRLRSKIRDVSGTERRDLTASVGKLPPMPTPVNVQ